mmetsp:Transcript_84326/g.187285  ORF Transcript_84326/g.187285 Transcript_84326/m.187285 type:complete len:234 (-) Transcript_84326:61-762(-)
MIPARALPVRSSCSREQAMKASRKSGGRCLGSRIARPLFCAMVGAWRSQKASHEPSIPTSTLLAWIFFTKDVQKPPGIQCTRKRLMSSLLTILGSRIGRPLCFSTGPLSSQKAFQRRKTSLGGVIPVFRWMSLSKRSRRPWLSSISEFPPRWPRLDRDLDRAPPRRLPSTAARRPGGEECARFAGAPCCGGAPRCGRDGGAPMAPMAPMGAALAPTARPVRAARSSCVRCSWA